MPADPTRASEFEFDAFISYSHLDREWVDSELLPALRANGIRFIIDSAFDIGKRIDQNIASAMARSRHIIVVVSANWVKSEWSDFELGLGGVRDPAARRAVILPVLIGDCELPARLQTLTYADFRRPQHQDEMKRLLKSLKGEDDSAKVFAPLQTTVPEYTPPTEEEAGSWLSDLASLVVRSGRVSQAAGRVALCYQIGIQPGTMNTESVPSDFAEQLTHSLYESGNTAALLRLCGRIAPFLKGAYTNQLNRIRLRLGEHDVGSVTA